MNPAVNAPDCRHCGTPIPEGRADDFCCGGCAFVHDLLHSQGLDRFYQLRGDQTLSPVPPQALRERDYAWLLSRVTQAEQTATTTEASLSLSIQGLSCVGCIWLIERLFTRQPGALRILVDVVQGSIRIDWAVGAFDAVAFAAELQRFGYLVGPHEAGAIPTQTASGLQKRLGACGAFAMNAMAFSLPRYFGMPPDFAFASWFELIAAASATLALLVGGSYFITRAWTSLRAGTIHLDTPIALGILTAYTASIIGWLVGAEDLKYFDFVAMFIFLMLTGRWAQQAAVDRNRRKLMRDTSIPDDVALSDDDRSVPLSELTVGSTYHLKPGQAFPVASRLETASAQVSLEWINGESEAVLRQQGQLLPAGALNIGHHPLHATALETWDQSTLRRLLEARRQTPHRDLKLEALLRTYLAAVLVAGIGGAVWWWSHGATWVHALQVMVSVFVVSCPCAIGVAIPLAEELATSRAERLGVFVRQLGLWKRLRQVRQIVFDKTGTLTLENPRLVNSASLTQLDPHATSALRRLVTGNLHPVSRSLFDAIGPGPIADGKVEESVGHGLTLTQPDGSRWSLHRPGPATPDCDVQFTRNEAPLAGFQFEDHLRSASIEEVANLHSRSYSVHILSGDRLEKVALIAAQLQLPQTHWKAGLHPEDKAAWIRQHHPSHTLYIGDGANDSLAFDEAQCTGSPMGGRSFLEQKADFFFLGHSLAFVARLLDLAATQRRAVHRVFAFSLLYNLAAASACLTGYVDPLLAAILMPLSSLATLGIVGLTFRLHAPTAHALTPTVAPKPLASPA